MSCGQQFNASIHCTSQWTVCLFVCLFVIYLFEQVEVLAAMQLMWTCYTHPPIYTQRTATTPGTSFPTLLERHVILVVIIYLAALRPGKYPPPAASISVNSCQLCVYRWFVLHPHHPPSPPPPPVFIQSLFCLLSHYQECHNTHCLSLQNFAWALFPLSLGT